MPMAPTTTTARSCVTLHMWSRRPAIMTMTDVAINAAMPDRIRARARFTGDVLLLLHSLLKCRLSINESRSRHLRLHQRAPRSRVQCELLALPVADILWHATGAYFPYQVFQEHPRSVLVQDQHWKARETRWISVQGLNSWIRTRAIGGRYTAGSLNHGGPVSRTNVPTTCSRGRA